MWTGKGLKEKALSSSGIIDVNKKYFRPLEVDHLKGDYSKAKKDIKMETKKMLKN